MAKYTKNAIMVCFLELLNKKSLDKITVKDIVEKCDINRNTFYYYYKDIYDVLEDVFNEENKKVIREIDANTTFYDECIKCASIIKNYAQAIKHIYMSKHRDVVDKYLESVIIEIIKCFVSKEAEGYNLSKEDIDYICYFYSYAIVGTTVNWIQKGMPPYSDYLIKRMSDSFQATIKDMINMCCIDKKQ